MPRTIDPNDGRRRCRWAATDPLLAAYHDKEWGRAIRTDAGHLERMALEVFQCGLSWKIVLVKRPALRTAFVRFDPARVARMSPRRIDALCADAAIIRNRRKIEAIVENAATFIKLARAHGSYLRWLAALPADTPAARKALLPIFRQAFRFMGPETTTCYLMGVGKIPPAHDAHCWRRIRPLRN